MEQEKKFIIIDKTEKNVLNYFQLLLDDKYEKYEFSFLDDNSILLMNPVERREMDELGKDRVLETAIETLSHRCIVYMEECLYLLTLPIQH